MNVQRVAIILFLLAVLTINPVCTFAIGCNWEMHRGNPARTGAFDDSCGLSLNRFAKYWEYDTNAATLSPPIVYGDKIVYISDGGRLNCISSNGRKEWSKTLGSVDSDTIPAIWNDLIFVPGWRSIDVFYLKNGRERFSIETNTKVDSVLVVPERGLFYTSTQNGITNITYLKNPLQQKKDWTEQLSGETAGIPSYSAGRVYVASEKSVHCFNYRTGSKIWKKTLSKGLFEQSVTVSGDNCFVSFESGEMFCLSSSNGSEKWNIDVGDSIETLPSIYDDSLIVGVKIGSKNFLKAIKTSDGSSKWIKSLKVGEEIVSAPISSSKTYFATKVSGSSDTQGVIYCIDSKSGKTLWQIEHTRGFTSAPAISDGSIFIGDELGKICSFGAGAKYLGFQLGQSSLTIDSTNISIDSEPVIAHDRTLIPARYVIEPLGGWVRWDAAERKVTSYFAGEIVEFWIGKNQARVDGKIVEIDPNPGVVPSIINGRTMVPFRFLGESHGCNVDWIAETKEIRLTYKK